MNLFLTGAVQTGKSTLIRHLLARRPELRIGGFRTVAGPLNLDGIGTVHIVPARGDAPLTRHNRIIERRHEEEGFWIRAYPEVFDTVGCALLARRERWDVLLMDEVGVQESEALRFQRAVLTCLDGSIPVLGVVQDKPGILTDAVRSHPKTKLITVTVENRDELLEELAGWIR